MVTIPTNSTWHDKPEVKKGDIGELIVQDFFERKGYVIYAPKTDKPHGFDFYVFDTPHG